MLPEGADAVAQALRGGDPFLEDLLTLQRRVAFFGYFNSLAQTLLKLTCPGVPELYQGTELWDFSLVDPDNRRPVDYARRRRLLDELRREAARARHLPEMARRLTAAKEDGRIKLYVTARALRCRRDYPGLFAEGDYLPAEAAGARREHVCAFVRRAAGRWALAAVPRLLSRLLPGPGAAPLGPDVWQDSALLVPGLRPGRRCRNAFTGEVHTLADYHGQAALPLAHVFAHFPVALLLGQD
jgi:(1->4)-alpha-D-glucan 1-alpha-D-glucosylmutase